MKHKATQAKTETKENAFPRIPFAHLFLILSVGLSACAPATPDKVTLMLDWVPNVNHTGLFVAQKNGYFAEQGLEVNIVQPGEVYAEQAVAGGAADFGVSFQEQVTLARANDGVPLVSLAAIIQHNTSGFAARAGEGARSPADWAGLRYGAFGSPFESPTLKSLMECAGGDFAQLQVVETGFTDPLALLSEKQIDLAWIFFGTQGVTAEAQGIPLDVVMMDQHFDCIPDYYTPVLITSEKLIAERPDAARRFLAAVSQGYDFAIEKPNEAATILHEFAPESDLDTLIAGQLWLAPRYQAQAARWGEQQRSVWEGYAAWMQAQGLIKQALDADKAFTNEFLP
jgi:ABC-type nitrate/sulfonate/bicarbonate transport system substrate-binding protein